MRIYSMNSATQLDSHFSATQLLLFKAVFYGMTRMQRNNHQQNTVHLNVVCE